MKSAERLARQVAPAVEIALPGAVGVIHHPLVVAAALDAACKPARDRPEAMRANPGRQRHGMAHKAADAPVAVQEGVNVVEPVVGCRHGEDATAGSQILEPVALLKIRHERLDAIRRRRQMSPHGYLMVGIRHEILRGSYGLCGHCPG